MLQLKGQQLTLQQIVDIAKGREQVVLGAEARVRVDRARQVVQNIVAEKRTVYGVNTGFGKLSDVSIDESDLIQLQLNLVRSHSCGLGEPLSEAEARAMLLLRANVLASGFSGARPLVIEVRAFRGAPQQCEGGGTLSAAKAGSYGDHPTRLAGTRPGPRGCCRAGCPIV